MTQGLSSLFWFVAVLAAIPLVLWFVKRSGFGGGLLSPSLPPGAPRTVASLVLSGQQRVVTVEVGQGDARTWLVLGVSAQGIQPLHSMPAGALPPTDDTVAATAGVFVPRRVQAAPAALQPFAQALSRALNRQRHAPR